MTTYADTYINEGADGGIKITVIQNRTSNLKTAFQGRQLDSTAATTHGK